MPLSSEQLIEESLDPFDYVSLSNLASLDPSELVLLELPQPWRPGRRYRCMAKESFQGYAATSAKRLDIIDEGGATGRGLVPTYLPGVDLEERDFDFLVRTLLDRRRKQLTLLHVERIVDTPPERVLGPWETEVHIYEIAEARWERELWQLFDRSLLPEEAVCPEGHPLYLDEDRAVDAEDQPTPVICDECERVLVFMPSFTCSTCDFDLCKDCHDRRGSNLAKARDPVAWLESELTAFWDAHPNFILPPTPPQLSARCAEPSVAVTKWNDFAAAGAWKLQLRSCFLTSLETHGASKDIRCSFWPGCAQEIAQAQGYIDDARTGMPMLEWWDNALLRAGAAVVLGSGPPLLLQKNWSDREWQLEDGRVVTIGHRGDSGATAWLAQPSEAQSFHGGRLRKALGPEWSEECTVELLGGAVELLEALCA